MITKLIFIRDFIIPIAFVVLGIYLLQKGEKMAILVGFVNIFFWTTLLLFTLYKLVTKK